MPAEFRLILKHADAPGYTPDMECYLRHGGYEQLKKALATAPRDLPDGKKQSSQEVIRDEVLKSGLRGRHRRQTAIDAVRRLLLTWPRSGITPIVATYLLEANGRQPWYVIGTVVFAAIVSMLSAIAIGRRRLPAPDGLSAARTH